MLDQTAELQNIAVSDIEENPLNHRSMDADQIAVLADSLQNDGLLEPLIVYPVEGGKYRLVAGHRRKAAIERLGWETAPCIVYKKPEDEYEEVELLAKSNIHRSSPEDVQTEAREAERNWNVMPAERKKAIKPRLEQHWIDAVRMNPKYISDSQSFKNANYRPKLEYVKMLTGLDVSNSTVKDMLKPDLEETSADDDTTDGTDSGAEYWTEEDEAEVADGSEDTEESAGREVKKSDVKKAASALNGLLDLYDAEFESAETLDLIAKAKQITLDLINALGR